MKHVRWAGIIGVAAACGTSQPPADTVQFDPATPAGASQSDAAVRAPFDASSGEFPPSPVAGDAGSLRDDGGVAPVDVASDGSTPGDAGGAEPGDAAATRDAGAAQDAGTDGGADAGVDAGRVDAGTPPPDDDD